MHFKAVFISPETGHRPWWSGRLLRQPHIPPSKIQIGPMGVWRMVPPNFEFWLCSHALWNTRYGGILVDLVAHTEPLINEENEKICARPYHRPLSFIFHWIFLKYFFLFYFNYLIFPKSFGIWKNVQHDSCLE